MGDGSLRKVTDGHAGEGISCVMILRGTEQAVGTIQRSVPSEQPCVPGRAHGSGLHAKDPRIQQDPDRVAPKHCVWH